MGDITLTVPLSLTLPNANVAITLANAKKGDVMPLLTHMLTAKALLLLECGKPNHIFMYTGKRQLKARRMRGKKQHLEQQRKLPILTFPSFDDAREIKRLAATSAGAPFIVDQL